MVLFNFEDDDSIRITGSEGGRGQGEDGNVIFPRSLETDKSKPFNSSLVVRTLYLSTPGLSYTRGHW